MKKKLIAGIFALALLVTTGYGVSRTMQSDVDLTDLAFSNVEALADGEDPDFWLCKGIYGNCVVDDGYLVTGKRVY